MSEAIEDWFDDADESCPNCNGEGYVACCFEEWACIDPEGGCDECMCRCDWCNPKLAKEPKS